MREGKVCSGGQAFKAQVCGMKPLVWDKRKESLIERKGAYKWGQRNAWCLGGR